MSTHSAYKEALPHLPDLPGVYRYYDKDEKIIYVGKAKNLKKRVSSYFMKDQPGARLRLLVRSIVRIEFIVVNSEIDALILENQLIKAHKPKFNVQLKDDKTYPFVCIKKEHFPRVQYTRQRVEDGTEYYGPFPSVTMMKTVLNLIKQLYPLRTCTLNLSPQAIAKNNYRACLEAQIGNCLAPCENRQKEEDYNQQIEEIREIVKGNISVVIKHLTANMQKAAEEYRFEQAHFLKKRLDLLQNYQSKSAVLQSGMGTADVFTWAQNEQTFVLNYTLIQEGRMIFSQNYKTELLDTDDLNETIPTLIYELRERFHSKATEIYLMEEVEWPDAEVKVIVPKIGDKRRLIDLSKKNADYELSKVLEEKSAIRKADRAILEQAKKDLALKELPVHIECFDNSNFHGTDAVSACVVFKNAKPSKKDYRIFNVKTVVGANDFDTMKEAVFRRYRRLLDENEPLPQVILIDGGKGQLGAARESLEKLDLIGKVALISIAKNLEELYFPGDELPIHLDKRSTTLKMIQHLRDEAHRFGIKHHRNKRSKTSVKSELDSISGIGEKTKATLLKTFGSVKRIKAASESDLIAAVGKQKAAIIQNVLK